MSDEETKRYTLKGDVVNGLKSYVDYYDSHGEVFGYITGSMLREGRLTELEEVLRYLLSKNSEGWDS